MPGKPDPIPGRPQPTLEKRDRRVSFTPSFAWVDWEEEIELDGGRVTVPRRTREVPHDLEERAAEIESEIRAELLEAGLPLPRKGAVRDRVLRVVEGVPAHDRQRIVALVKETPPFWGVTTERARG